METNQGGADRHSVRLWYTAPGEDFFSALPVGNGRLGGMVYGGVGDERIQFNEDTLWSGGPHDNVNPKAAAALPKVRKLIFEDRLAEAEKLIETDLMGRPVMMQAYQPFGDLHIAFAGHEDAREYERELDLEEAVAGVRYRVGDVVFTREVFVSHPAQVMVVRLASDRPGKLDFEATLTSPHPQTETFAAGEDTLRMVGALGTRTDPESHSWTAPWEGPGLRFEARLHVKAEGGAVESNGDRIAVRGADSATLLLAAATNFRRYDDIGGDPEPICERRIRAAAGVPYGTLREQHVEDYRKLFDRVAIDLGGADSPALPTDERITHLADGDVALAELVFQYGRYLLISSSRPGTQAANLQGIWNDMLWPWWGSKYTININIQMNYWPAEVANLGECHGPLFDLIADLSETGARAARAIYGCGGFVTHHNTDIWRLTAAVDGVGTYWQTGAAWLTTHLFEHYLFTGDAEFLRRAYPLMKEAARFFVESLVEIPQGLPFAGKLVTSPSSSPETGPVRNGVQHRITYGPTMDLAIIHHLFTQCIEASKILATDEKFRAELERTLEKLPPLQVGRHGQLQEWIGDWDDPASNHHHVSHLYALFPGSRITPDGSPGLAAAAAQSLIHRSAAGGGFPGVWRGALWARLRDGGRAYEYLCSFDRGRKHPNMFVGHSQLDGTFGVTALIAEMLIQSHTGVVELLPALPEAWSEGGVRGLCARGGFEVAMSWQDGKLTEVSVMSKLGNGLTLRYGDAIVKLETAAGRTYRFDGRLAARR